ncbi:PEP-CTERM sorting domain-containing protein [Rhodoferax ferrireducens]|uniref:PEP-CTERM sorting domain-containing protein n=1 Tax=Rhodoferax ferrireducens TaxID=192843 RepID=UPI00298E7748|nr:PEP-CTERM sorting domain-containing protein [Rhodoferax ferrireducens]WPC67623.1 PEP-CTERM sorting domain-containing protein [Rhodoferax ferrireducens]
MDSNWRFATRVCTVSALLGLAGCLTAFQVAATPFIFNTGNVDGRIATASRPAGAGKSEIESADDFVITSSTTINSATFTGLLTSTGGLTPTVGDVRVEIYHVFPKDSAIPPSGNVPTRVNSPSDVTFRDFDAVLGGLTFSTSVLSNSFTALNSVMTGINPAPNQTNGGEGPVNGQEVTFNVTFTTPFDLPADHYYFVPQVQVTDGEFLWLSAARPIGATGTPFSPDLQTWIRNENLAPDWLRVGTDIVGGDPAPTFNAAFSLNGRTIPEPGTLVLLLLGLAGIVWRRFSQ